MLCSEPALFGLRDVRKCAGVLPFQFAQPFLVEMDAALVAVDLILKLQTLVLRLADVVLQLGQPLAQLRDFIFAAQHVSAANLDFRAQLFHCGLPLGDFVLEQVEVMAGQLRIQVLQLQHELLVTPRLSSLTLQGADLPFHFPDQIRHAQQILLRVFEFAERLALLCFEFGDCRRFFEYHAPIFRFAGKKLRDISLRHDAVTGAPHAGAHEQLLNVL